MTLFKIIKLKLGGSHFEQLVDKLGYHNSSVAVERLRQIETTKSTFEWFQSANYDFKYSNEEFLVRVCKLLAINSTFYKSAIDEAKDRLSMLKQMHQPFIQISTDFKRNGQNLMALGYIFRQSKIYFDKEPYLDMCEKDFLQIVSRFIKKHYKKTGGELEYLGEIKSYTLFDRYGKAHIFDTSGRKISKR